MKFQILIVLIVLLTFITCEFKFPQKKFSKCLKKCKEQVQIENKSKFCIKFCLPKVDSIFKEKPIVVEKHEEKVKPMSDSQDEGILDPKILWQRYRTALFDFFRMGDKKAFPNLMLLTTPYPADKFEDDPRQLAKFLNLEPKQSSTYEATIINIPEEYGAFLRNVKTKPQEFNPNLEKLGNTLGEAQDKLYAEYNACQEKYDAIKGYKDKYEDYQYRVCWKIKQQQSAYEQALFAYDQERLKITGDSALFTAYNNYYNAKGVFNWEISGGINSFQQAAKDGKTNSWEVKITSMTRTSVETIYTTEIGFGLKAAFCNFSLGVDGKYSKSDLHLHTTDSQFQLVFGAKGYKAIPVNPANWFSAKAADTYKNGPFVTQPSIPYFGKNGKISLIPKTMYLVVGPKIDMYVSEQDKDKIEQTKNFSMSANFGYMEFVGLKFNFNKGSSYKATKETDKLYKITVEGNSYEPQILLMDYDFYQ